MTAGYVQEGVEATERQLLAKLGTRHLTDPYRLCSTQHCQVYAGAGHEDPRLALGAHGSITSTSGSATTTGPGRPLQAV